MQPTLLPLSTNQVRANTPLPVLSSRRKALANVGCMALLLLFALAVVSPVLSGKVPIAADTLGLWAPQATLHPQHVHNKILADGALLYLPWQLFVRRSVAGGEWPLWDPGLFAGYPFLGNFQNKLYYPIAWLLLLLPLPTAIQLDAIINLWLAGTGMYALARVLGVSRPGSLIAGLVFAGSGQLYTSLEISGISDIYIWLPWVVAASEVAWRRRSWRWAAIASLLFGMLAVSGQPQWFFYSSVFLVLWMAGHLLALALRTFRNRDNTLTWRLFWGQLARATAILTWGPTLAAVHILPFVEMLRLSSRVRATGLPPGPDDFAYTMLLLGQRINIFVPQFFGTSAGEIGSDLSFNNCWYVGLAPLALATVAILLRRERKVLFLGAIAITAFAVASGLPLFNRLNRLPGLDVLVPDRTAYLFIFCAAVLSGLGFDALLRTARSKRWLVTLIMVGFTAFGVYLTFELSARHAATAPDVDLYNLQTSSLQRASLIAGALAVWAIALLLLQRDRVVGRRPMSEQRAIVGRPLLAALLIVITVFDLLTYAPGYNTYSSPDELNVRAPSADAMRADAAMWRMMAPDDPYPIYPPNSSELYGLPDVQGYDSLHFQRYEEFWAPVEPEIQHQTTYFNTILRPQNYFRSEADLLNVKYIATFQPLGGVQQTSTDGIPIELGSQTVAQTFQTPERLAAVDLALAASGPAQVTVHIRRSITDTQDLAASTIRLAGATTTPWVAFDFQPLDVHKGDPLSLLVETPDNGVRALASKTDTYSGGALYVQAEPQSRDIAFRARGILPAKLEPFYDGEVELYKNNSALPRVFTVGASQTLTATDIPGRVADGAFNPLDAVLLEEQPPPGFASPSQGSTPPGRATVTSYRNLSVDIDAIMDRAGWLVLGDVNYPGWQVEVDGKPTHIYTAYYILRAVPLVPGSHHVHFFFRPTSVLVGGAISLLALLTAIGVLLGPLFRRPTRPVAA
jgi:hypothetical protein